MALSRARQSCVLHVDIGGGTTKLALIDKGHVVALQAFAVGGRLIAQDEEGRWSRFDDSVQLIAEEQGWPSDADSLTDETLRKKYARRLAEVAADYITFSDLDDLGKKLGLTEPLPRDRKIEGYTFSGGVGEYIFTYEDAEYGDIAKHLAHALTDILPKRSGLPLIDPGHRIRATVIGASQFTVQVSGKTIYIGDEDALPVHNIPVIRPHLHFKKPVDHDKMFAEIHRSIDKLDMDPMQKLALALTWDGDPEYSQIAGAAKAIKTAFTKDGGRDELLVLMIDGDIAKTMGRILREELHMPGKLVSIDGIQLQELDFVDVGEMITPPGVVPVVIKSLLFS